MSSQPDEHSIAVTTHGRYLVEAASGGTPAAGLLVGFHGYGESADHALEALGKIPGAEAWTRAALQGLNVFYQRRTGQVVASWMTRFQREVAIEDNLAYVAAVLAELEAHHGAGRPRVLTGFSQGVAMAYRAAVFAGYEVDGLVVLAGDVPPDLGEKELAALPPVLLGRGEKDDWYTDAKLEADVALLEAAGVSLEVCRFAGGHEWAEPFLEAAGDFLKRLE